MRLNVKVAATIAAAAMIATVGVGTALAATAATQNSVALKVGSEMDTGYTGAYGDEITLQPAVMDKIELPGEKFSFLCFVEDTTTDTVTGARQWKWLPFLDFEDIQIEDTNTVQPFVYRLGMDDKVILTDGSVVTPRFPYQIRCEYKTADSSGTVGSTSPKSYSETETVSLIRNNPTAVRIATSGGVRLAGTRFVFQVTPNSGVGKIKVTVTKPRAKTLTYQLTANEDGIANAKLKLGTGKGVYTVRARFLGNTYGAPSATAAKTVKALR